MSASEDQFQAAARALKDAQPALSQKDLLTIYALFKQASEGDCTKPQPSRWNMKAYYKWEAWSSRRSMSKAKARALYCEEVQKHVPSFALAAPEPESDEKGGGPTNEGGGGGVSSEERKAEAGKDKKKSKELLRRDRLALPPQLTAPATITVVDLFAAMETFFVKVACGALVLGVVLRTCSSLGLSFAALEFSLWIYYGRFVGLCFASDLIPCVLKAVLEHAAGEGSRKLAAMAQVRHSTLQLDS